MYKIDLAKAYSDPMPYDTTEGKRTIISKKREISIKRTVDIKFLDDNVMGYVFVQSKTGSLNTGDDTKSNFLWPKHMCKSILFEKGEDYRYDQYLNSGGKGYPGDSITDWQIGKHSI